MPLWDSSSTASTFSLAAQVVDHLLQLVVPDAERPVRHEALGMRDRHVGNGLADDRDPASADLPDDGRFEHAA